MIATLERPVTTPRTLVTVPPTLPQADRRPATPKLHALTSLRFFAAAMIVLFHSQGYFGTIRRSPRFTLTQGVCFFFGLPAFILAYAYPALHSAACAVPRRAPRPDRADPCRRAADLCDRIARLVSRFGVARSAGARLLTSLLQAWVPVYRAQTAFNGVSWSLSLNFFFYLCFPLLLWRWRRTWGLKLALAFPSFGTILVANRWLSHLPAGRTRPTSSISFPPARVWEFVSASRRRISGDISA